MKIVSVQFTPWDKAYNFSANDLDLSVGDRAIVKTEMGVEMGTIVEVAELKDKELENFLENFMIASGEDEGSQETIMDSTPGDNSDGAGQFNKEGGDSKSDQSGMNGDAENTVNKPRKKELKSVLRKATVVDIERLPDRDKKQEAMTYCKEMINKHELPMKLVDIHYAFDGSRITFAFIADGRIDFRELVKDLTRHFNRTIRLQQIGIRDEAKIKGDCGHCGRPLCCRGFLTELVSITSDMAETQLCAHRGSDRISGICGRLMCCLAYENLGYEELRKKMPPIGARVRVDGQRGVVLGHHPLKHSVDVEFPGEKEGETNVVEVDLDRNKKK